jgi:hypothetical protein
MPSIFLSHSSQDNFEAVALRDWLAREGWDDVFLDLDPDRGIAAGERWERALHEQANRCEAVIFLVSANWLASGWCLKEYTLARTLNKKLFAVVIDPAKSIAELPPELKGTWQAVQLTVGQDGVLLKAQLPGSHEEKHLVFSRDGLRRLKRGLDKAGLDAKFFAWPPEDDRNRSPYRGLKPLDGVDAGIFFGRDAPIVEAADRLRGLKSAAPPRLLVILGASGAGKSSFLRAGLLPRLARDDLQFLPLPAIRPERAALYGENGLLAALEPALPDRTRAEIRAAIQAGASGVRPLLAELVARTAKRTLGEGEPAKPPAVVIAIDQAEELFRAEGAEEGGAFLTLLRDLSTGDQPAIILIFAIRSDAYDALEHAKPFEGLPQSTLPLLPMPRSAYKDVIEGPARRYVEAGAKLDIEPLLTQRLLDDLDKGGGSDALPLLAFTLEQLFLEYRRAGVLRRADYEAFGGLRGAIVAGFARVCARPDADPRIPRDRAARGMLLRRGLIPWLAGIDPDTKSPRRNIARRSDVPPEAGPLIDLLIEERLLATDTVTVKDLETGEESRVVTLEPAHEALLRQWALLDGWLQEDFAVLAALEAVKRAARDWDANGRSEAWLAHQGQRLSEAQALDARPDIAARLDGADRAYLSQCRAREETARAEAEARRREREDEQARRLADAEALAAANRRTVTRTRLGLVAALALALAAVAFGFYALEERRDAKAQSARAERALRAATKTANSLVSDVAEKFRHVVGVPTSTIKAILDPTLQLQDDLVSAGDADPDLRRSQSAALNAAVGTLLTLGDGKDALADALESRDIMQSLLKLRPADVGWRSDLCASLKALGDVDMQVGDQPGALAAYQEELATARELARENTSLQAKRDLWRSLVNVGAAELLSNDTAGASAAYREGLAVARDLAKDKSSLADQRDLELTLDGIGDLEVTKDNKDSALAAYQEELAIVQEMAQDKTDAKAQRDLSVSSMKIGDIELQSGDTVGALAAYQESLAIFRELAKDKTNVDAQVNLTIGLEKVGDAELKAGDRAAALAAYDESFAVARRTSDAETLARVAYTFLLAKEYQKSLEASDLAISMTPGDASLYTNKADALMFLGRLDEARAIYLERRGQAALGRSWESMVLEDFAAFRKAGLANPLMDEIEKTFATTKQP